MSRKRTSTGEAMFSLAIITNILSRLPVKSILRFKCVSKSWLALINSPSFIASNLHQSTQNPSLIIRYYNHRSGNDPGFILLRIGGGTQHDVLELPLSLRSSSCFPKLVGSCNGLLCLDVSSCFGTAFVLWNLGTNEFKRLPKPLINERRPQSLIWMVSVGFGFNQVTNDYQLVRIVNFAIRDDIHETRVEVYKTSTRNWKEIDTHSGSCVIYATQDAVAVKGVLHWMANGIGVLANSKFVMSYDMNQETFLRTVMPEFPTDHCIKAVSYNESLALVAYPGLGSRSDRFEFWVMNEGKNWTKEVEIGIRIMYPIGSYKESEIIVKRGHEFFLFDPSTRKIVYLPIDGKEYTYKVFTYVDSLVGVDGFGEK